MKKNEVELIIDDRPIDFSKYNYTDEEWERFYQEMFGDLDKKDKQNDESES